MAATGTVEAVYIFYNNILFCIKFKIDTIYWVIYNLINIYIYIQNCT